MTKSNYEIQNKSKSVPELGVIGVEASVLLAWCRDKFSNLSKRTLESYNREI